MIMAFAVLLDEQVCSNTPSFDPNLCSTHFSRSSIRLNAIALKFSRTRAQQLWIRGRIRAEQVKNSTVRGGSKHQKSRLMSVTKN